MGCASSSSQSQAEAVSKYEFLAASPFFLHLTSAQLRQFAAHFRFASFQAGETVFEQGQPGAEFYLLGEGECDITLRESDDPAAPAKFLCSKKQGDLFGEKGVLEE